MDRNEAKAEYKWNLKDIYLTEEEWESDYNKLLNSVDTFLTFKGKLNDKKVLMDYNKFSDDYMRLLSKVFIYTFLNHDVNLKESRYIEQYGMIETLEAKIASNNSYFTPELSSLDEEYLKSLIEDEDFKDYKLTYEAILENKKHILSEKEENIASLMSSFESGFSKVYDTLTESDMKFKPVIIDGEEHKLTIENFVKFLTNPDRRFREQAYRNLYDGFEQFAHTNAMTYIYDMKLKSFDLKLRNYSSLLEASLSGEKIPEKVYYNLINSVDNNVFLMHKYFSLLKKNLKLDDFGLYDTYMSLSQDNKREYDFEEQFKYVKDALSVLGEDYVSVLEKAKNENWVDVYSNENKAGGGYNIAVYDTHPYILLNDNASYNSMSTLAHELGHAMHSYYSNSNQPSPTADYSIFVAEVASTVNEILLNKYMLKNATSVDEKIFYLDQHIKNIKSTVFRQTMFSEFEDFAHKLIEQEKPVSMDILNEKYLELNRKYFGEDVIVDDRIAFEWNKVSHFYRPYYVFKYATSFTSAVYIANCILENKNNMKENYRKLLKSGGSKWPDQLLKDVGVNLETEEPYKILFDDLKNSLKKKEKLIEEKNK